VPAGNGFLRKQRSLFVTLSRFAKPPPEMDLEVQWQEHELGSYPTIVLTWEDGMRGAPWEYIEKCDVALTAYEEK